MHRSKKPLTVAFVSAVRKPGKYYDGQGLYLRVYASGARCWEQRVTILGRRRTLGLGGYPIVTLLAARERALENQRVVSSGQDPFALKRRKSVPTFAEAAAIVLENLRTGWSDQRFAPLWFGSLRLHAFPRIGNRLISDIAPGDILAVLLPIWKDKAPTARNVRARISSVMKWAMAQGYRDNNPAGEALAGALPRGKKEQRHQRALPYGEVAGAIATVYGCRAKVHAKLAFEFLVLTAARSGETRGATWAEMDLARLTWTVPAWRRKARVEHSVPLSSRAVAVLEEARALGWPGDLIFGSETGVKIHDATLHW